MGDAGRRPRPRRETRAASREAMTRVVSQASVLVRGSRSITVGLAWGFASRVDMGKRRVGFGSGQGRVTGRIGRPAPDPYLSPGRVGLARAPCAGVSGRVFFGLGRVFWPLGRVFRVGSGFGSKITARARPVDCCGSKNTARAHPPRSSGRVGFFSDGLGRVVRVGLFGSGDPCPGLIGAPAEALVPSA